MKMDQDQTEKRSLSRDEVRTVDRKAIERYGLPGIVLMENAGQGAAALLLEREASGPVLICCGKGNNGGDGFVIARHLDAAGCEVRLLLVCPVEELSGDASTNAEVARRSGLSMHVLPEPVEPQWLDDRFRGADWIVDALLGTGTRGGIRPPYDAVIEAINRTPASVLAVDLPSGLDCDTGRPLGPCVRADITVTFVAEKKGFGSETASEFTGQVHVVGIGAPGRLLREMGVDPPQVRN